MQVPGKHKWDEVTPEGLYNIIQYLKDNFDPDLSKKVIELFHERIRDEIDFDPALLNSLMRHVFAQILEGHSADQAFGLKAIKGKYNRPNNEERDMCAACIVILQMRNDTSWENAVTDAAEHLSVSDQTVARAYKAYRDVLEMLPSEHLESQVDDFLPPS